MDGQGTYPFSIAPNVTETPRGGILVGWTTGQYEIAPNTVIMGRETFNEGESWNYDSVVMVAKNSNGNSVIGTSFVGTGDRMFLFYNHMDGWARSARGYFSESVGDLAVVNSTDTGYYWSEPTVLTDFYQTRQLYILQVRANGIRLKSGELLVPVDLVRTYWPPVGKDEKVRRGLGVVRSTDSGKTWQVCLTDITDPELHKCVYEPSIIECRDGSVLAYLRTSKGTIWQSRSFDKGISWSMPTDTGIIAPHASLALAKLPDGRFCLAWNDHPAKRTNLSIAISEDEGKTWIGPDVIDMVCIEPISPMRREQVANIGMTVDRKGQIWMVWSHIVWYDNHSYGSIKYACVAAKG
jgi:hypothetical protein